MDKIMIPQYSPTNKTAGFDLDYTLICTKSGRRFPKDKDDWKLMYNTIPNKLKQLYEDGYSIIVFTNQKNLEKRMGVDNFKSRCVDIQNEIGIPMIFYIASGEDNYLRKPFPGMFEYHKKKYPVALHESFYVGDAWCKKKCFNDSDLCFARNCGLTFYKAKEYFDADEPVSYDFIPPSLFPKNDPQYVANQIRLNSFIKDKQYIFLIGGPATGKTTFCRKYLSNYLRLSKDDHKTPAKYRNIIQENLEEKIVFDNTNYTYKSRQLILSYLNGTNSVGYVVRHIPKSQSLYLNQYRHYVTKGAKELLPSVAIHTYYKRLDVPVGENVFVVKHPWIFSGDFKKFYC